MVSARKVRIILVVVFLLTALFRIGYGVSHDLDNYVKVDARAYHQIAVNLLQGNGYVQGSPESPRPAIKRAFPLMPVFLAAFYGLFGPNPWYPILFQLVLSAFLIFPVYGLTYLLSEHRLVALTAVGFAVILPDFTVISGLLVPDFLGVFSLVVTVYFALLNETTEGSIPLLLTFLSLGLLTLLRPHFLPIGFLYGGWLLYRDRSKWRPTLAGLLVFALLLLPFTIRNYQKYHSFIYASTTLSCNVLVGNQRQGDGEFHKTPRTSRLIKRHADDPLMQRRECWDAFESILYTDPTHVLKMQMVKFMKFWSVSRTSAGWFHVTSPFEVLIVQGVSAMMYLIMFTLSLAYAIRKSVGFDLMDSRQSTFLFLLGSVGLLTLSVITVVYFNHRYRTLLFGLLIPATAVEGFRLSGRGQGLSSWLGNRYVLGSSLFVVLMTLGEIIYDWPMYRSFLEGLA